MLGDGLQTLSYTTFGYELVDAAVFNTKQNAWELTKGNYEWLVAHDVNDIRCTSTQKVAKTQLVKVNK